MHTLLFLSTRVLHVVLAGAWLGAAMLQALFLLPSVQELGLGGAPVLATLVRRGVVKYMASIGGLTVLTGVALFYRFSGHFDPEMSASRAGMAFSVGGLLGLIALILGGSMVGGSAKKLVTLGDRLARLPEGAERAALLVTMDGLRAKMLTFARVVVGLLVIAMAAMALGHYI